MRSRRKPSGPGLPGRLLQRARQHWLLKAISLALATILWTYLYSRVNTSQDFRFRLVYEGSTQASSAGERRVLLKVPDPERYLITGLNQGGLKVTVEGPRDRVEALAPLQEVSYVVDVAALQDLSESHATVDPSKIDFGFVLHTSLTLSFDPPEFRVLVSRKASRQEQLRPDHLPDPDGKPREGYIHRREKTTFRPASVTLTGPEQKLSRTQFNDLLIQNDHRLFEPANVEGHYGEVELSLKPAAWLARNLIVMQPIDVRCNLVFEEMPVTVTTSKRVEDIQIIEHPARIVASKEDDPDTRVDVRLTGPASAIALHDEKGWAREVFLFCDPTQEPGWTWDNLKDDTFRSFPIYARLRDAALERKGIQLTTQPDRVRYRFQQITEQGTR